MNVHTGVGAAIVPSSRSLLAAWAAKPLRLVSTLPQALRKLGVAEASLPRKEPLLRPLELERGLLCRPSRSFTMSTSKGMVVVSGLTYRITERPRGYEVIRLLDDRVLGCFGGGADFDATCGDSPETLAAIARVALREGKLRWVQAVGTARLDVRALLRQVLSEVTSVLSAAIDRFGWVLLSRVPVPVRASALGSASRRR